MSGVTIGEWLADLAARYGDAPALRGVAGAPALTHARLAGEVAKAAEALAGWGLGRGDAALVALPDGPGALMANLAAASAGAALPAPEVEQPEQYAFLLDAAPIRAVLMRDRPDAPLARLARARGLTVVTVAVGQDGGLTLSCARPRPSHVSAPTADDDAILMPTAGTTAEPKIVVISHASLCRAASRFRDWVGFGPEDRALCMMPAAHLHSFVRSALPVLMAGGEVVWAPGFDTAAAPGWIDALRPTWISAAPAIHRGLLAAAGRGWNPPPVRRIGVGSDRIQPGEVGQLAAVFGAQVFQFYGMTETTPFVAMTPAEEPRGPPDVVGRVNPDWKVSILSSDGAALPHGAAGEIAVAGSHVNPVLARDGSRRARLDSFGRLRTGDIGRIDANGFLHLEGRADDRIHRGGEKIPPTAVEAALESHPAVARAVAFGLPDPVLGERVAVAVEPAEGALADEALLAAHAGALLPRSMVPERFFFTAQIPVSSTGKISRRLLADKLAGAPAAPAPARSDSATGSLTESMRTLLSRSLNGAQLGAEEDFFNAGGDSLRALEVLVEIEDAFGVSLPPATFARNPTAAALARELARAPAQAGETRLDLVQEAETPGVLFAYGVDGRVGFAHTLAAALGPDEGLAAFHCRSFDPATVQSRDMHRLAEECARIAVRTQPSGPFCLAGFSFGAQLALAIAQQLVARRREVAFLGVVDDEADLDKRHFAAAQARPKQAGVYALNEWAIRRTPARFFAGRITYFPAAENAADLYSDTTAGWSEIALGGVDVIPLEGSHHSFEQAKGLGRLAPALAAAKAHALADPAVWARAPAMPDTARALRFEARRTARLGDRSAEIEACQAAITADRDQPPWLWRQLAAALAEAGAVEEAVDAAHAAVACDPWPLESLVLLAPLMRRLGHKPFRERVSSAAKAEPPGHPSVEVWRADALLAIGRKKAAEASLRRGLALAPHHYRLRLRLAGVCGRAGRLTETAALLSSIVEDYPSVGFLWRSLGKVQLAAGEPEAAEHALRALLRLHNDDATGWALLSETLERLGRPEAAAEARVRAASCLAAA